MSHSKETKPTAIGCLSTFITFQFLLVLLSLPLCIRYCWQRLSPREGGWLVCAGLLLTLLLLMFIVVWSVMQRALAEALRKDK